MMTRSEAWYLRLRDLASELHIRKFGISAPASNIILTQYCKRENVPKNSGDGRVF